MPPAGTRTAICGSPAGPGAGPWRSAPPVRCSTTAGPPYCAARKACRSATAWASSPLSPERSDTPLSTNGKGSSIPRPHPTQPIEGPPAARPGGSPPAERVPPISATCAGASPSTTRAGRPTAVAPGVIDGPVPPKVTQPVRDARCHDARPRRCPAPGDTTGRARRTPVGKLGRHVGRTAPPASRLGRGRVPAAAAPRPAGAVCAWEEIGDRSGQVWSGRPPQFGDLDLYDPAADAVREAVRCGMRQEKLRAFTG